MSTKLDSQLWRTSRPQGPEATDRPCRYLEWSAHFRWNTNAPLISFVFFNLTRNLLLVRAHVGPRVCKIFSAQSGIRFQKISLTCTKAPRLFEEPHRDSSAHDAGFAPTHIGATLNPRKCVADVAHRPLQQLCFFSASQFGEQLFGLFQSAHRRRQGAACLTRMQAALC